MIRAVLDTNVLASAIIGVGLPSSVPGDLLRRWRRRQYSLIVSEHILAELARTLASPYSRRHIDAAQLSRLLQVLRRRADMTPIATLVTGVASHPEDDLILSAAVSATADYLVTGDQQLQRLRQHRGVIILSPRAFLTLSRVSANPSAKPSPCACSYSSPRCSRSSATRSSLLWPLADTPIEPASATTSHPQPTSVGFVL